MWALLRAVGRAWGSGRGLAALTEPLAAATVGTGRPLDASATPTGDADDALRMIGWLSRPAADNWPSPDHWVAPVVAAWRATNADGQAAIRRRLADAIEALDGLPLAAALQIASVVPVHEARERLLALLVRPGGHQPDVIGAVAALRDARLRPVIETLEARLSAAIDDRPDLAGALDACRETLEDLPPDMRDARPSGAGAPVAEEPLDDATEHADTDRQGVVVEVEHRRVEPR